MFMTKIKQDEFSGKNTCFKAASQKRREKRAQAKNNTKHFAGKTSKVKS